MFSELSVFIPTRGRYDKQITTDRFCIDQVTHVTYIVPHQDKKVWVCVRCLPALIHGEH